MSELERHRDALREELEQIRAEIAKQTRSAGGDEAERLRSELSPLQAEVARLTELMEGLTGKMVEIEDELEELRREAEGARRHLADLHSKKD